jgi:hypothetical protein
MSLKDLFGKTSEKIISNKQLQSLYDEAESKGYLEELYEDKNRYLPPVDFSSASNFARYGSAEKYYTDAIKNIYQRYPYDGSKKEKMEWRNKSSQFDLYVFDNIYPKTAGYVTLSGSNTSIYTVDANNILRSSSAPQYISVKGGPNSGDDNKFETGNIFDLTKNRESNLGITSIGNTVEFWFKDIAASGSAVSQTDYCLFDLWNTNNSGSSGYTRLTIKKNYSTTENKFAVSYISGTSGIEMQTLDYNFDPYNLHHYAFVFKNSETNNADLNVLLYVDGELALNNIYTGKGNISLANNYKSKAYIGAYQANSASISAIYDKLGSCNGSFDEFRFWKEARTSQDISRYWFTGVGGGSNTDDSNTSLGLYYKFNEGIINTGSIATIDASCLDYSGRMSNGIINNYSLSTRNTSSAIDDYFGETIETKDPIIYSTNPLIENVLNEYAVSGSEYDYNNNSNIYKSLPDWITDDAEVNNRNDLSNLVQIISSYFDTLHIQIENLPKFKEVKYNNEDKKPNNFINTILSSYDFNSTELFNNLTFLEEIFSRNEEIEFDEKLHNIKNTIYQNIYNNLSYIYKSKGTEKSFRNLIRCFGIDDELIKINLYPNNAEYDLTNNKYKFTSINKRYVDFNNSNSYEATVYQKAKDSDNNTRGFLTKTTAIDSYLRPYRYSIPITVQTEIIFPKKVTYEFGNSSIADFTEVSLFGLHVTDNEDNLSWGSDQFNFQVYAIKPDYLSKNAYFKFTGSLGSTGFSLTSSYYYDVYDNQKWNFSVRLYPNKLYNFQTVSGSDVTDYTIELVGHNYILDTKVNETFIISASIPESNAKIALSTSNKRIYIGAHRQDFNGAVLAKSDVKISSVKVWYDYLNNEEVLNSVLDATSRGRINPTQRVHYISDPAVNFAEDSNAKIFEVTKADTLALHWDFSNVSSSNASGQFIVEDISSGSAKLPVSYGYNWFGTLALLQHTGLGYGFAANNDQVINKEFVHSAKLQNPEVVNANDLIQTPVTDDLNRSVNNKPINYYLSLEKSMSQIINDEILNWLATLQEYNNSIGSNINRYKNDYSDLTYLRTLFFQKVQNYPDFERFIEFYKWIDSSISEMLVQLVPASANIDNKVKNVLENTFLVRNKYESKLPLFGQTKNIVDTTTSNIGDSFIDSLAPYNPTGSLWLKKRGNRTTPGLNTPGEPQNDIDREIIRQVLFSNTSRESPSVYSLDTQEFYNSKKDLLNFFSKTNKLLAEQMPIYTGTAIASTITNLTGNSIFTFAFENIGNNSVIDSDKRKFNTVSQPILYSTDTSSSYTGSIKVSKVTYNFSKTYEVVNTSGRLDNNKSFVVLEGAISGSASGHLGGTQFFNKTLPVRQTNKRTVVERFSAPGGPEVNSRGALDEAAEEYSVYNGLNNRNYRVRKYLNSLLAETSSIDSENPSFHKVPKNIYRSPADDSGITTNTKNDNEFVTHIIPRSDKQYTWTTASLSGSYPFSFYLNELNYADSDYLFITSSLSGTSIIDFVGLNTHVLKTVDTSSNTISTGSNFNGDLNKYILNTIGPYGYFPSKQLKNAYNKLSIESRKNNKILVQDKSTITRTVSTSTEDQTDLAGDLADTFTSYKEPVVTYNVPMKHKVNVSGSSETIVLVGPYDNNKERVINENLSKRLDINYKTIGEAPQLHDILKDADINDVYSPKPEYIGAEYGAVLYPRKLNVGSKEVRYKEIYEEINGTGSNGRDRNIARIRSVWKNSIDNRRRINAYSSSTGTGSIGSLDIPTFSSSLATTARTGSFLNYVFGSIKSVGTYNNTLSATLNNISKYDSIWSSDFSESLGYNSSYTTNSSSYKYNISSSIYGELYGHNELELLNLISKKNVDEYSDNIGQYDEYGSYIDDKFHPSYKVFHTPNLSRYYFVPKPSLDFKNHFASYTAKKFSLNIKNNGMVYKTDSISGKKPWYNNYEEFYDNIRHLSTSKSLIPEYKINSFMDYFVKEKNGNFFAPLTGGYLSLDGATFDFENIASGYNVTDNLSNFIFEDIKLTNRTDSGLTKKLYIKINGVKKLLPYKGFYPQERAVQIVDLFQKSFFNLSSEQLTGSFYCTSDSGYGSPAPQPEGPTIQQQISSLLQPFFAPGILFNTIKAGLAVDWPIYFNRQDSAGALALNLFTTGRNTYKPNYYVPEFSSFYKPSFDTSGNYYNSISTPYFYTTQSFASESPYISKIYYSSGDYENRAPFESLLDINLAFKNLVDGYTLDDLVLYYIDPTRQATDCFSGSIENTTILPTSSLRYPMYYLKDRKSNFKNDIKFYDSRYYLAINNYLAEIPNFFLKDSALTTFKSKEQKDFPEFQEGKKYEFAIALQKTNNIKTVLDIGEKANTDNITYSGFNEGGADFTGRPILPAASTFGPPTAFLPNKSLTSFLHYYSPTDFYSEIAYAPYVPSYWYGKTILKISFIPTETRKYELQEIFNKLSYIEQPDGLEKTYTGSIFFDSDLVFPIGSLFNNKAYQKRMPISSSLNLNLISSNKEVKYNDQGKPLEVIDSTDTNSNRWVIQTKFESPILNFNNNENINEAKCNVLISSSTSDYTQSFYEINSVGMWTGYGSIPNTNENINIEILDPYADNTALDLTQSLAQAVGFTAQTKNLGELAVSKTISEAIVLIPYVENKDNVDESILLKEIINENGVFNNNDRGSGPYYFKINPDTIEKLLKLNFADPKTPVSLIKNRIEKLFNSDGAQEVLDGFSTTIVTEKVTPVLTANGRDITGIAGNQGRSTATTTARTERKITVPTAQSSIIQTIKGLLEYNVPPHLDWVVNRAIITRGAGNLPVVSAGVPPFVMYFIEFKENLSQQDLVDIWQGVMPSIAITGQEDIITIEHPLNENELFEGKPIPNNIKWKVFKVKKKANNSYFSLTEDSRDDTRFKFEFAGGLKAPEYSYNWPYDFFSLVELVNIEAGYKVEAVDKKDAAGNGEIILAE